ncbi:MAG: hypothetical protein ACTSRS_13870 [Candidatus Helarchaeota archaeon]
MNDIFDASELGFQLRIILNICLIIALWLFAIIFLIKRREKEGSAQRNVFLGYALFLISYAAARILFVFSDFEVRVTHSTTTPINDIYVGAAYSFGILGALFLVYVLERHLLHTYYIFSAAAVGLLGLSILSTISLIATEVPRLVIMVMMPVFFLIILFLYLYVAMKASGDPQKRALGIVLGLLIMMIGFLIGSGVVGGALDPLGLYEFRILIEPLILIIGSAIFTLSQR